MQTSRLSDLMVEFYHVLKEIKSIIPKLPQKYRKGCYFQNCCYDFSIKTIEKHCRKRKTWTNIPEIIVNILNRYRKAHQTAQGKDNSPWSREDVSDKT